MLQYFKTSETMCMTHWVSIEKNPQKNIDTHHTERRRERIEEQTVTSSVLIIVYIKSVSTLHVLFPQKLSLIVNFTRFYT